MYEIKTYNLCRKASDHDDNEEMAFRHFGGICPLGPIPHGYVPAGFLNDHQIFFLSWLVTKTYLHPQNALVLFFLLHTFYFSHTREN